MSSIGRHMTLQRADAAVAAYNEIAPEYYDAVRHPTCANFRIASERIISSWLNRLCTWQTRICEVGAGRSLLLEFLLSRPNGINEQVIITDASATMLQYSQSLAATAAATFMVAPAHQLPFCDHELSLVLASLGDSYNYPEFWLEARRVLMPGGHVIFTTPSHKWASAFRERSDPRVAEFELTGARTVRAPSWIYDVDTQLEMTRSSGFCTVEVDGITIDELNATRISEKLRLPELKTAPILNGYLVALESFSGTNRDH
jgi:ubiquinone/menaquinone biosynthesis C-methylase UbiE